MTRMAVLLRAVNLGARNRIAMPDLRRVLEGLGCADVSTYLQSGNAVVTRTGTPAALERDVAAALAEQLDLRVAVMVRTGGELARVVEGNPWGAEDLDLKRFHAAFLSGEPDPARVAAVDHAALAPERLHVGERVLYLDYVEGVQRSRLGSIDLGVAATARNWRTVLALRDLTA